MCHPHSISPVGAIFCSQSDAISGDMGAIKCENKRVFVSAVFSVFQIDQTNASHVASNDRIRPDHNPTSPLQCCHCQRTRCTEARNASDLRPRCENRRSQEPNRSRSTKSCGNVTVSTRDSGIGFRATQPSGISIWLFQRARRKQKHMFERREQTGPTTAPSTQPDSSANPTTVFPPTCRKGIHCRSQGSSERGNHRVNMMSE